MPLPVNVTKAIIFSAGLGTRFKPWTDHHPKALAIINGKSLLQRNVEYLQQYGITDVVVNVHHFAGQVEEAIQESKGWGSSITISDERNELLETGGGLLHAAPLLKGHRFISLNVDILTDLDINRLLAFHLKRSALVSFGITNRKTSRNFLFDNSNRLSGWVNSATGEEKIVREGELHPMAYSCVSIYEPGFLDLIPQRGKFSVTEPFLALAPDHPIYGMDHSGNRFIDVGKPESVALAEKMFQ